jgi:hypothetical protein
LDLADVAQRLEVIGQARPPHRDPYAPAAFGQGAHHLGPDETGAAENSDQARAELTHDVLQKKVCAARNTG